MIESILTQKAVTYKGKITIKSLVSVFLIVIAVGLPQLVHLFVGSIGGAQWLPMYLPVLIGGCLLGIKWGVSVGVLSPILSFLITFACGNPMPLLDRLPYMVVELAVLATLSGLFSKAIVKNEWLAFSAAFLALLTGRAVFLLHSAIFQSVSSLTLQVAWAQVQSSLLAVVLWSVVAPLFVIVLKRAMCKNKK